MYSDTSASSAVQFAQQDRLGIARITRVHEILSRLDRKLVHHLQSGGDDAGRDDGADRLARLHHIVKCGEHDLGAFRYGQQFDGDFDDHAQHALGASHQREQVIAGRVQRLGAYGQQLAFHRHHFQHQDVVHRQAVFQAMHAAGIFRDIAAYRAGDLRRRIGRVIHAIGRRRFGYRQVAHAGLHGGHCIVRIDVQDVLEFCQAQQHAIRQAAMRRRKGRCPRRAPPPAPAAHGTGA